MAALHITKETFEEEVLQADKSVLVDFWASWCGPCQMLLPIIEEIAEEVTHAKICKVNVDEEPELAQRYKIMTIPTLMVVRNGVVTNKSVGGISKEEILDLLK